jgi:hypothetical protein
MVFGDFIVYLNAAYINSVCQNEHTLLHLQVSILH